MFIFIICNSKYPVLQFLNRMILGQLTLAHSDGPHGSVWRSLVVYVAIYDLMGGSEISNTLRFIMSLVAQD